LKVAVWAPANHRFYETAAASNFEAAFTVSALGSLLSTDSFAEVEISGMRSTLFSTANKADDEGSVLKKSGLLFLARKKYAHRAFHFTEPSSREKTMLQRVTLPVLFFLSLTPHAFGQKPMIFTCGKLHTGSTMLTPAVTYSDLARGAESGGFDLKAVPFTFSGNACSSDAPFFFSVSAEDGNYEVTVDLGSDSASSNTAVRAESRRLLLQQRPIAAGKSERHTFIINVRTPAISAEGEPAAASVKLKPREIGALDWDTKLTLEFNGSHPSVRSILIHKVLDKPTLYLAGDSTVVDQDKEPWAAWGQMLPWFFDSTVAIANNAESGETIHSFVRENRLAKIMSTIRKGDYLFIQFAHNDQKPGTGFVSIPAYKDSLRSYIQQARDHGAIPILVTSMNRRKFDMSGHIEMTLGDYPAATRDIAAEQKTPLIDLNVMSKTLFEAMGEQGTLKAFVHYPANTYPGQNMELNDDTHFNSYGAYELARCIVQNIQQQHLPLAARLRKNIPRFDPSHPDLLESWEWPPSPMISTDTPYGR
jgi:lysophospholipase L1-like esterase